MRPVSGPFLKAVVASQDLGAAGTEFERSLIVFPFSFPPTFFCPPLSSLSTSVFFTFSPFYFSYFVPIFFDCQGSHKVRFLLRPMLFQIGVFGGMRNQIQ
jgi:hypothetical protein